MRSRSSLWTSAITAVVLLVAAEQVLAVDSEKAGTSRRAAGAVDGLSCSFDPGEDDALNSIDSCTVAIESGTLDDIALSLAYRSRAAARTSLGQIELAITDLNATIELLPTASALAHRGFLHKLHNDKERALVDFEEAIRRDPNFSEAYSLRASVYLTQGEYEHAIADVTIAIRLDSDDAGAYFLRGSLYSLVERYDPAILDFGQAILRDARFVDAFLGRADAHSARGNYLLASADYDSVIRLDPNSMDAHLGRGFAALALSDPGLALADFNTCIAIDPNDARGYLGRGSVYAAQGNFPAAIREFSRSIQADRSRISANASQVMVLK